jgi:hypothetical protein
MTDSTFGDNVRVKATGLTESLGLAGLVGVVLGETTPSVTDVVGTSDDDYAINVSFENRGEDFWFAAELLEFVDHGGVTEAKIGDKRFARDANGEWRSVDDSASASLIHRLFKSFRNRR